MRSRGVFGLLFAMYVVTASTLYPQAWTSQEANFITHYSAVSFLDEQTGYISGAYGVVAKTTDGGLHWVQKPTGVSWHFSDQSFVSPTVGWVVGQQGIMLKTTNGGESWTQQTSGTSSWLNYVCFKDQNRGWAAGENGTIITSTNGGTTWSPQVSGTSATIEGGWFCSMAQGFMACNDGSVAKTLNGGANWTLQSVDGSKQLNAVSFPTSQVGWAVGIWGKILKTTNGGATWTFQTSGTIMNLNAVAFVNVDTGWVAGDAGFIAWTTNGGATWVQQPTPTGNNLRSIFFLHSARGYAVGLNNTVLVYDLNRALPIQLASFTAAVLNARTVRLNWRTISEINNYGFEMQRSPVASQGFQTLPGSFVPGHGTTNEPQNYSWIDNDAVTGRSFYRLKQIDLDGTIHYTDPISVDVTTAVGLTDVPVHFSLQQNYPNPFNPATEIGFSIADAGLVSLRVFDLLGREVAVLVNEELQPGKYVRTFRGDALASGVYCYRLTAGSFSETKRFVLSK